MNLMSWNRKNYFVEFCHWVSYQSGTEPKPARRTPRVEDGFHHKIRGASKAAGMGVGCNPQRRETQPPCFCHEGHSVHTSGKLIWITPLIFKKLNCNLYIHIWYACIIIWNVMEHVNFCGIYYLCTWFIEYFWPSGIFKRRRTVWLCARLLCWEFNRNVHSPTTLFYCSPREYTW